MKSLKPFGTDVNTYLRLRMATHQDGVRAERHFSLSLLAFSPGGMGQRVLRLPLAREDRRDHQ